ncbi:thioredoxin reductase [Neobacillus massiliamazoniensis]|uniref:Thioredoxin reductase n=1 Tax=Neobacillus massiliamazoniensis TaxID=1499688 RepID=A0A0U1NSV8_9BACI|nr:thioredoxin reductase [Neobacillus massiliamazoniensis]
MLYLEQHKPIFLVSSHVETFKIESTCQAITAAGTGFMAALDAERYLESDATHDWSKSL